MKVLTGQKRVTCMEQFIPEAKAADELQTIRDELNKGCPLGVSRVSDGLYVCGAHALPGAVRALAPRLLISAAPELPPLPPLPPPPDEMRTISVPLLDTPQSDMIPYLDKVADAINEVVSQGGTALVHCVAGVSRSVTLCLAYLVKWRSLSLTHAYRHMKLTRPQIRPNTGFFRQLIKYEERVCGVASVRMVYCDAIDKEVPDVYEPEYRAMACFRQRYGPIHT